MSRLFYIIFAVAVGSIFFLGSDLLDFVGWQYSSDAGSLVTRIHPGTYLIVVATLLGAFQYKRKMYAAARNPEFIFYNIATLILLIRAFIIQMSGITGGEVTTVITNFVTPSLFYLCIRCIETDDLQALELPMRAFFVINSLMALSERLIGHRLIPGFLDKTTDIRSTAFVAHPLNGSLLTGLMITFLLTARRGRGAVWSRFPELGIHALAMFAFGGRSALVFTPMVAVLSAIFARRERGQADVTTLQRALPAFIVLLGICLVFLPIPFVDATLDRFSNDANSSEQRNIAIDILSSVSPETIFWGVDAEVRFAFLRTHHASAFELCWVALTLTYGLLAVLPMMVALPMFLYRISRSLDRSAFYLGLLLMIVTAGSLSIGVKSLLIPQCVAMMAILSQRKFILRPGAMFEQFAGLSAKSARDRRGPRPG